MIDNKGRLFGKINIVDLLIVVLVVVTICATVYKFGFSAHNDVNETNMKIEYVLKASGVREFTLDSMKIGDAIYDEETDKPLGIITAVEAKDAMDYALKADGTTVYTAKPDRYDAYITIESDARNLDGGYYANGTKEIGVFSNIKIYSQSFCCETTVQNVAEKN